MSIEVKEPGTGNREQENHRRSGDGCKKAQGAPLSTRLDEVCCANCSKCLLRRRLLTLLLLLLLLLLLHLLQLAEELLGCLHLVLSGNLRSVDLPGLLLRLEGRLLERWTRECAVCRLVLGRA